MDQKNLVIYRFYRVLLSNKTSLLGMSIVLLFILTALFSLVDKYIFKERLISAVLYSPSEMSILDKMQPPSLKHPFGTDQLGRDVLTRIIYGSIISLGVCVLAVGLSGVTGTIIGLFAGYFGGKFDDFVMRIVDIMLAFPGIILAIAVTGFLGPGLFTVVIALSVKSWVTYTRLMRSRVFTIKTSEYIRAIHALGAGNSRIIFKHILPNCITPIIVQATMDMGGIMIAEAGLSFLSLGPQPPIPSWGNMLSVGRSYIVNGWWMAIFPGIAIFLTVLGFNIVGDILQDALDPKIINQ